MTIDKCAATWNATPEILEAKTNDVGNIDVIVKDFEYSSK